jgi:23S rRNA (guanine2445-N2)-methyltransferase / 23S rRNA (guanine2069-N7)-methyltransferase
MKNSNNPIYSFFASTPKGLELLLVDELRSLGALDPREKLAGVAFSGDLSIAYKACLWSRLANRVLLQLKQVSANTPEELYAGVQTIAWDQHIRPTNTIAVQFISSQSNITHSLFGAQKVKDAIVDQFRKKFGERPSVQTINPDVSIHVYLHRDIANISIDLSGESLHRRGYRREQGAAPLKENLAAAILLRAGWKDIAKRGGSLIDPMCGSGTLLVEAALMAGEIAPGLLRDYFGFFGWKKHNEAVWNACLAEAKKQQNKNAIPPIIGYDKDVAAIQIAQSNIKRAGLQDKIRVEKQFLSECSPEKNTGLMVVNPPYGERLNDPELPELYTELGNILKQHFIGWKAAVFTGNPEIAKNMGFRLARHYALFNGAIPCKLLLLNITPEYFVIKIC